MGKILDGLSSFALPYLDDVAIYSDSWEDHTEHVRAVLDCLQHPNLTMRPKKCLLGSTQVSHLGHIIGQGSQSPHEAKVAAVVDYPRLKTKTDVHAIFGLDCVLSALCS